MKVFGWEPLGSVPARRLAEARLLAHHAVQLVAAVGRSMVPGRPDDGHTSLDWQRPSPSFVGQFVGQEVPGSRPWRPALRPDDLSLAVLAEGVEVGRLALAGRAVREAFAWLGDRARDLGAPADRLSLEAPYTLPEHAIGAGAVFAVPGDGSLVELANWFANADALLRGVADGWAGSAPVRVWPHHFDVGSVLPLGPAGGADASAFPRETRGSPSPTSTSLPGRCRSRCPTCPRGAGGTAKGGPGPS